MREGASTHPRGILLVCHAAERALITNEAYAPKKLLRHRALRARSSHQRHRSTSVPSTRPRVPRARCVGARSHRKAGLAHERFDSLLDRPALSLRNLRKVGCAPGKSLDRGAGNKPSVTTMASLLRARGKAQTVNIHTWGSTKSMIMPCTPTCRELGVSGPGKRHPSGTISLKCALPSE